MVVRFHNAPQRFVFDLLMISLPQPVRAQAAVLAYYGLSPVSSGLFHSAGRWSAGRGTHFKSLRVYSTPPTHWGSTPLLAAQFFHSDLSMNF